MQKTLEVRFPGFHLQFNMVYFLQIASSDDQSDSKEKPRLINKGASAMRCTSCKSGEMVESKTSYFAQLKDCYVIIENVPCMKCGQCGDVVFRSSVVEKIDDMLFHFHP